ncbi:MAG: metallophosphoesterase [Saccharofermentans sp.]|nr:metallophosphoesterase [Saccharofermentans sp.]
MKILIVSDSHGRSDLLYRVALIENPDMVIHLGDLEDNVDSVASKLGSPEIPCVFIAGNCDRRSQGNMQDWSVFTLKEHRFFCTHGNLVNVHYGLDRLVYSALENKCDIALYGHTHVPFDGFEDDAFGSIKIHVLNPGSIARPRSMEGKTYMIMDLHDSGAYEVKLKTLH